MALRRGMNAVREIKDKQGTSDGGGLRFILKDGESAVIRIYGDFEGEQDPVIYANHYVKRIPNKPYHNCAENSPEGHGGCVFCWAKENGDKGVNKSARALFFVRDTRKQHKFDADVRVLKPGRVAKPGVALPEDAYTTTKYPPCRGNMCSFCKGGNEARENGYRKWELALQYAEQLLGLQATVRDFCRCGARTEDGGGTLYPNKYTCGNPDCGTDVDFDPALGKPVAKCDACGHTTAPNEILACTAECGTPSRCDLQDFFIRVKRTGSQQDTSYNFEVIYPCRVPTDEELKEAGEKKPNFEAEVRAEPSEMQARHLGIPVPDGFSTAGHGAQNYEQPSAPPRAAPPKAGPPRAAPPPPKKGATPAKTPVKIKFRKPTPVQEDGEIPYGD